LTVLHDFDLSLEADDVLRAQGGDPAAIRSRNVVFVELAEQALAEGMPLLQPVVAYRRLRVEGLTHECLMLAKGGSLSGPLVAQHLSASSQVVAIVCTVGPAVETRSDQAMASNPLLGLALDGVGSAAAEALATAACQRFEQLAAAEGQQATVPINPGMVGWPVSEGQRQVFSLLDAGEIGVELLPSGMMVPRKSVSLVIGLGDEVSGSGVPCDFCNMADRCRYRSK
jgi:hypothetical protein